MRRTGAPVETGAASREFFAPAWRAATEFIRFGLVRVFDTRPWSPAGACATPLLTEATVRRAGALVALGAASVLVPLLILFPAVQEFKHGVLAAYAFVMLGCGAVLFSPAHRAVAELARRAAEATCEILDAAWSETSAAAVRVTGALVALAAASALVPLLIPVPADVASKNINGVLTLYAIFLLGCAAVLLSPADPDRADNERRAAEAARNITTAALRWGGFTCICIVFCAICAVGSVCDDAAAAPVAWSPEQFGGLVLFLLFLAAVWTVTLSMVTTGRTPPTLPVQLLLPLPPPPPAEDERDGGAVNCTPPAEDRDGVASKHGNSGEHLSSVLKMPTVYSQHLDGYRRGSI